MARWRISFFGRAESFGKSRGVSLSKGSVGSGGSENRFIEPVTVSDGVTPIVALFSSDRDDGLPSKKFLLMYLD